MGSFGRGLLLALSVSAAFLLYPGCLPAQTVDEIINAYLKARGGLAKLRSVQTERFTGTVTFVPGVEGPFFVERKRPLKMRMEMTLNSQTLIRVYDGNRAAGCTIPSLLMPPLRP